jgi:hypothetical protein
VRGVERKGEGRREERLDQSSVKESIEDSRVEES